MFVSIGFAAKFLGVAISTLRRWHKSHFLIPNYRTEGGHRRYSMDALEKLVAAKKDSEEEITLLYARTSGHDQAEDLARQIERLEDYSMQHNFSNTQLIKVKGSGLNYKAPGLKKLIKLLLTVRIQRLILVSKDRLLRFGADILFEICSLKNIEVVILDEELKESFEQELTFDLICILTVFTSKLYGKRSHKNRKNKLKNSKQEVLAA